jgi:two-component system cell cycle response regulator
MNSLVSDSKISFFGEFTDKDTENEFINWYILGSVNHLRVISIILGILNSLFIIPDYFINASKTTINYIIAGRSVFIIIVLIFAFIIKKIKNHQSIIIWITLCEALAVVLFLFVYYIYESPDFLIQAFGAIAIVVAFFMVPNKWVNTAAVSMMLITGFFIVSFLNNANEERSDFVAGSIYLLILFIASLYISLRNNINERIQYINRKELIRLSETDPLSGVYNRLKMDQELKKWVEYSKRYSLPLTVAIFDFDNFKNVNDTYGHLVGDNIITDSAALIKQKIRHSDVFARWGGEEFMLLLPNTDVHSAMESVNRIRSEVEKHIYLDETKITCSIGLAELLHDDDVVSFIQKADKALYIAKVEGKNRVAVYGLD